LSHPIWPSRTQCDRPGMTGCWPCRRRSDDMVEPGRERANPDNSGSAHFTECCSVFKDRDRRSPGLGCRQQRSRPDRGRPIILANQRGSERLFPDPIARGAAV